LVVGWSGEGLLPTPFIPARPSPTTPSPNRPRRAASLPNHPNSALPRPPSSPHRPRLHVRRSVVPYIGSDILDIVDAGGRKPDCGTFLRDARIRHGLGQADLARLAGTSQAAISRVERGLVSPTLETLDRLFGAMGETLSLSSLELNQPPPEGGNQSILELRADYENLTAEQRLSQTALLSEIATGLASGARD